MQRDDGPGVDMKFFGESLGRRAFPFALLVFASLMTMLGSTAAAAIGDEEELWRVSRSGTGAGEMEFPAGLASDPRTGHLFVIEQESNRVSEFTPWGDFVKAFGWDVAPGAVNEQQEVRVRATEGQFKLEFGANTTGDLPFDATEAEVETALNALPSISGDVSVRSVEGNPNGVTPYVHVVTFDGPPLAGTNVAQLEAQEGTEALEPATGKELEVRTRADGHAATVELEACTAESGCKVGSKGSGAGQLSAALGVAVDDDGNVYLREVGEVGNLRVQKFDHAGRFLLMFGGDVNKTSGAERCTKADLDGGDTCGIGVAGSGPGQFGNSSSPSIVLSPAGDKLFAGDIERIQRFDLGGEWEASTPVTVPVSSPPTTVHHLAIDPASGDFYATLGTPSGTDENVRVLDAVTGGEKDKLQAREIINGEGKPVPATKATAGPIAVDGAGNVFVRRNNLGIGDGEQAPPLLQFDPARNQIAEFGATLPASLISGLGANAAGDLHISSEAASTLTAFGPGPVKFEGPPKVAPTISGQFATSVQRDGASVSAEINPHFFDNTTYQVQYGTGKCSEGGCPNTQPVPPAPLTSRTVNAPVQAAAIFLEGLQPGTTYHYRFIAESGGGGPVYGIDPDGDGPAAASEEDGLDATFITPDPIAPTSGSCPANEVFRGGAAARLPNCRAYEMVSPIDKNNGDIKTLVNIIGYSTMLGQSAPDGARMTYSSYRSFADPKAAPFTNQILATRTPGGWRSEALNPPRGSAAGLSGDFLDNDFKAFSADLCRGWLMTSPEPLLDPPHDTPNYYNLYRRDNCGAANGSYAALSPATPTLSRKDFFPEVQGSSASGQASIFRINDKLTPNAASGRFQTYYARPDAQTTGDALKLLCILPSGAASGGNCSGGTGAPAGPAQRGRIANVTNAISTDGNRVYWTDSAGEQSGPGRVYLRINPGAAQSGGVENCEAGKACTLKVSETKTTQASRFLTANPEGSKALFEGTAGSVNGDLYEFNLGGTTRLIAEGTLGLAGTSEDLSRIYFVSTEALEGAAAPGRPNLYLEEGGEVSFIVELSQRDAVIPAGVGEAIPSVTARKPIYHAAQASADGSALAFISNASPTGYDNTDQESGAALSEIYLYEAGAAGPVCVSCNPSRARPRGRVVKVTKSDPDSLPMAATLPLARTMLHFPRAISADGSRLFVNRFAALLPRDTNGATDLYMWQSASGKAACAALGAELYVASASGCLSLISTGESPQDSEFLDASANGGDAFFTTNASLLPQDPGLIDVYDARAGGGLPGPPVPPPDCQGETCKPPVSAPVDPSPASSTYVGPGDVNEKAKKKKAKKKKAKAKKHKNKKQKGKQGKKKKANKNGRAAR